MLTPQDISSKGFVKAVFGGYDMATVDSFIENVGVDYAALYKENAILKSKIKVLVEKVEEYRSTEDAMRMALLTAQKMGDDLLSDTKQKCSDMQETAEKEAAERKAELEKELADETARLDEAKRQTEAYVAGVRELMGKELKALEDLYKFERPEPEPVVEPEPEIRQPTPEEREEQIVDTAMEIDEAVSRMTADEPEPIPEASAADRDNDEPTKMFTFKPLPDDDDEPTSPRPKFDFEDLKFGSNYESSDR